MPLKEHGFSLVEVLLAMAISSIMLLGASRFLPGLQRATLIQAGLQELEDELWLRAMAVGKQLQRAGYCAGQCQGAALLINERCVIVQWDANSNGRWERSPLYAAEQTGFRLTDGALETLRGATGCEGKGWDKLTDPGRILIQRFQVNKTELAGFAPQLEVLLSGSLTGRPESAMTVSQRVTGFNL
ncbi:prepilin peptidase-dependent protein [Pseudenterobacter timonensis]|uniref:prepilin peptidase-dependent protein n=1 Tax=Pseudenterobacter timonensis TaxID=1755099 RepID=UPI00077B7383|nr:prepilin peptidase-dependent protein [Pseudenterobacter timonensis]